MFRAQSADLCTTPKVAELEDESCCSAHVVPCAGIFGPGTHEFELHLKSWPAPGTVPSVRGRVAAGLLGYLCVCVCVRFPAA